MSLGIGGDAPVNAFIQVYPDSSGKLVDNSALAFGGSTYYRQRTNVSDPADYTLHARVRDTEPRADDGGLVVRPIMRSETETTADILRDLRRINRALLRGLEAISGVALFEDDGTSL
jgi:hypothetical protein